MHVIDTPLLLNRVSDVLVNGHDDWNSKRLSYPTDARKQTSDSFQVDEAAAKPISDSDFIRNYRTLNVWVL